MILITSGSSRGDTEPAAIEETSIISELEGGRDK